MNSQIKKTRLIFALVAICLLFAILISRIIYLAAFSDKSNISNFYDIEKINHRGEIFDRNNDIIATDIKTKSLYVSSQLVKSDKELARKLSRIFDDMSYEYIYNKIHKNIKRLNWILVKKNITPSQEEKINDLKLASLLFEEGKIRVYPQKSIFSHLLGYVDIDRKGLSGVERFYNSKLVKEEQPLQVAADHRVQDILYHQLQEGRKKYKAKFASGVIMNVNNGEVVALASLPSFDPNTQSNASAAQKFNRVTNGVYELGSVFKIFTNAIAFEEDLVNLGEIYDISDPIKYDKFTINDDHKDEDELSVEDIFAKSSNIGTVKIAQKIGAKMQKQYLKKFKLLDKIEADFPALAKPIYPRNWRTINSYTISYGHGIAVTPLHIAASVSAMINGGIYYSPSFKKLEKQPSGKRVIKESTSKIIQSLMRRVATDGTGRFANIEGYEVGGKTGTAEKARRGGYNERQTIASFVAAFPMNKPQYLVYVVFDDPNFTFNTGGMVAAPVAGEIIKNIAPILGVYPELE